MIKQPTAVINDFSGGQDTKTPIISMGLNKSPNMRNFHCAGIGSRLLKRGGITKINSSAVESDNLDCAYPPGYQTTDYALRDTATHTEISQGFKPVTSADVTKIRLWLKSVGTPAGTDTITLEIHTDNSGVPSGTPVANGTATAVDISDTLTSSYAWVTFTFASNPTLTAGTQYHLVLTGAFTISAVDYVDWGVDDYDVIFADGAVSYYDTTTWVADNLYDACFEVYITGGTKGDDGVVLWDFASKNMMLGVFGTQLYKMDKNSSGTPNGIWNAITGGSSWDTYTKFMSHFDGVDGATSATDEIGKTITFVGTAQLDTAQYKFGTASLLLNGSTDYVTLADSVDWDMGTGDFTWELQIRFADITTATNQYIISQRSNAGTKQQALYFNNTTGLNFFNYDGAFNVDFGQGAVTGWLINTWYHIAVVRNGDDYNIYRDGISIASTTNSSALSDIGYLLTLGAREGDGEAADNFVNGWIDECKISKGIARWTADFTPPTSAYSADILTLTSSRYWTFGDWQSGRALVNTDIGMYTYTGTGNASLVSAAPKGKFMVIWRNYVFIAGIRGSPNTVRYSTLSDYTSYPAANSLNFDTNDGDVITGMRILKGKLYIFKRYSVHRISYIGSSPLFQPNQIIGMGCPAHYTIKEVDMGGDVGSVLIFLTTDKKLAVFDGYAIQVLNDLLTEKSNDLFASADDQPLSFADINLAYSDLFHATVKTDTSEYILYCVLGSDTSINYAFVLDYKIGGIFPYDGQSFASSSFTISTNKLKILYVAGYSGCMYQVESGNADDGSAINAYWVSGKIKPSLVSLLNKMLRLGICCKEVTSASAINLSFQYRIDFNVSWISAQTFDYSHNDELAYAKTALFDIGTINNTFQIKIQNNSTDPAPVIYTVDLYGTPIGVGTGDRATV